LYRCFSAEEGSIHTTASVIALQKLDTGSARDVRRIADVPHSLVYAASESLEARDLLEVQQSTPVRYPAVHLDAARTHLRSRFEANQSDAFRAVLSELLESWFATHLDLEASRTASD